MCCFVSVSVAMCFPAFLGVLALLVRLVLTMPLPTHQCQQTRMTSGGGSRRMQRRCRRALSSPQWHVDHTRHGAPQGYVLQLYGAREDGGLRMVTALHTTPMHLRIPLLATGDHLD